MPFGAEDDGYEVNAPKGYPCGKAAQRQRDTFEKSLSMSRAEFEGLFEFLDDGLAHRDCDGTIGSCWSFCELVACRMRRWFWTFASKTAGIAIAKF